jgi:TatD DNase family protein
VLQTLKDKPKFITLHSRQAEAVALDILEEAGRVPVVFHWYTGSVSLLRRAVGNGHFFSINPAMINSAKGQKIIEALPPDRVLTESDGPFIKIGKRPVFPWDVSMVEDYLASLWQMARPEVSALLRANFFRLIHPVRVIRKS